MNSRLFKFRQVKLYLQSDLDKACFQHDMPYNKFKDLEKRTQPHIVLKNKALKIVIQNTMVMKEDSLVWFINILTRNQKDLV